MEMHETVGLRDLNRFRNTPLESSDCSDTVGLAKLSSLGHRERFALQRRDLNGGTRSVRRRSNSSCEIESHIPLAEF